MSKDIRCGAVVLLGAAVITLSISKLDGWPMWLSIMLVIMIVLSTDNTE